MIGSGIKSAKTLPVPIVEPETSIVPLDVGLAVKDVTFDIGPAQERSRRVVKQMTDGIGFLPMAISMGAGAEVQRPLATVVIGGNAATVTSASASVILCTTPPGTPGVANVF